MPRFLALLLLPLQLAAQSTPPARAHHTLFYDDAQQRVMLTGGTAVAGDRSYRLFNDLWSFDGTGWTQLPSSGDRMSGARVAIDAQLKAYSFGGWNEGSVGTLRVLENNQWRTIGTHPGLATAEGGFVFDAARRRFVAFGGGGTPPAALAAVWEYDGTRWSRSAATPPPARGSHAMVYNARTSRTVVFGGAGVRVGNQDTPILGDTWEYDGTTWTQMRGPGPAPRLGAGAAYDSRRGVVIVFGGSTGDSVLNDLWAWNGTTWTKLADGGPEPRVMGFIAYDKRRDRIVLFGGRRAAPDYTDLGDTWEWDGTVWRRVL